MLVLGVHLDGPIECADLISRPDFMTAEVMMEKDYDGIQVLWLDAWDKTAFCLAEHYTFQRQFSSAWFVGLAVYISRTTAPTLDEHTFGKASSYHDNLGTDGFLMPPSARLKNRRQSPIFCLCRRGPSWAFLKSHLRPILPLARMSKPIEASHTRLGLAAIDTKHHENHQKRKQKNNSGVEAMILIGGTGRDFRIKPANLHLAPLLQRGSSGLLLLRQQGLCCWA